jgi:hypothetical protein
MPLLGVIGILVLVSGPALVLATWARRRLISTNAVDKTDHNLFRSDDEEKMAMESGDDDDGQGESSMSGKDDNSVIDNDERRMDNNDGNGECCLDREDRVPETTTLGVGDHLRILEYDEVTEYPDFEI